MQFPRMDILILLIIIAMFIIGARSAWSAGRGCMGSIIGGCGAIVGLAVAVVAAVLIFVFVNQKARRWIMKKCVTWVGKEQK